MENIITNKDTIIDNVIITNNDIKDLSASYYDIYIEVYSNNFYPVDCFNIYINDKLHLNVKYNYNFKYVLKNVKELSTISISSCIGDKESNIKTNQILFKPLHP